MSDTMVHAPVSLLTHPNLTPATKVLWLARQAYPAAAVPANLALRSGLSLATVRTCLSQLHAVEVPDHPAVVIPAGLLSEVRVRPRAKLLFGILQTLPGFREGAGAFTYRWLSPLAQVSVRSLPELVRELAGTGWIQASQNSQKALVQFSLRNPEVDRQAAELVEAKQRLEESRFKGEAIMREFLNLLIDSDEFEDHARPGFLVNPLTDERMELDRYYPPVAGFEFQGTQHHRTTKRFPSQKALMLRQARDLMKEGLCTRRGVRLVAINPWDLNLAAIKQKIGDILPLHSLQGHEALVQYLDKVGRAYKE